jgi:hypothetical protein
MWKLVGECLFVGCVDKSSRAAIRDLDSRYPKDSFDSSNAGQETFEPATERLLPSRFALPHHEYSPAKPS